MLNITYLNCYTENKVQNMDNEGRNSIHLSNENMVCIWPQISRHVENFVKTCIFFVMEFSIRRRKQKFAIRKSKVMAILNYWSKPNMIIPVETCVCGAYFDPCIETSPLLTKVNVWCNSQMIVNCKKFPKISVVD